MARQHRYRCSAMSDRRIALSGLIKSLPLCIALATGANAQAQGAEFQELDGLFEPSGVIQLDNRRLLVIEDEPAHPFTVLSFAQDGSAERLDALRAGSLFDSAVKEQ